MTGQFQTMYIVTHLKCVVNNDE